MSGITDTFSSSVSSDSGGNPISGRISANGTTRASIVNTYPAGSVNVAAAITIPHATLKSLKISSDKNCSVAFNSSSSPSPLINIVAGWPFLWNSSDGYFPNPLTADITQIFISCTSAINFDIEALN